MANSSRTKTPSSIGSDPYGKRPPQVLEVEEAVLGALMLERDALTAVIDIISPETFYSRANQLVFKAIQQLFEQGKPIDIVAVNDKLKQNGELDEVGGSYYVSTLTNRVGSAANIEYHARLIAEKHILRELIRISGNIISKAYNDTTDVFELLDESEQELFDVSQGNIRKGFEDIGSVMYKNIQRLEELMASEDAITGIASGFRSLDRLTLGWQNSTLNIIAARPGMGKTAMVLSMARYIGVELNLPIAIFSLEMSSFELVNRLISIETGISLQKLKQGDLEGHEWEMLNHKVGPLSAAPIYIDDKEALSLFDLRARSRRLANQKGVKMVVVDYLQLMKAGGEMGRNANREQEIAAISRGLKALSKELDIPVIALAQLSRAPETRGGTKKPQLSDLRESGSIEQDADLVAFIYRPEAYGFNEDEDGNPTHGMAQILIRKHRSGPTDDVMLRFIPECTKFTDLDHFGDDDDGFGSTMITRSSRLNDLT